MPPMTKPLIAAAVIGALPAAPASAREIDRAEIAEDFAEGVASERKVYCSDTSVMTLADGTEYRACVNWRAQVRTRLVRVYAALDGPEEDADANIDKARDCFDIAVASQNDPYRKTFDQDAFLAGARQHFAACAANTALQKPDQYRLKVYDRGVWLGGS
ncbi:hypothetical protein FIU90_11875 [Erythrobacter sp. THAF29]|nr:hypothetical protein FIU90_11875 [Erythrobacter sp. THAF29]